MPCVEPSLQDCTTSRPIQANPDIAGIGVLASFVCATGISVLTAILIVTLDLYFIKLKQKKWEMSEPIPKCTWKTPRFWLDMLRRFLLNVNDTQLFTGVAVQITGLIQICTVSVYHFRIVTELAFLSTITHLLAVVLLRDHFVEFKWVNITRVLVMLLNLALLGYTSWISYAYDTLGSTYDFSPLACYFSEHRPSFGKQFIVRWTFLLLASIAGHLSVFWTMYFARNPFSVAKHSRKVYKYPRRFRLYILIPAYTIYGLVNSSRVLRRTQAFGSPSLLMEGDEREWGFGQVLAVLLLSLILLSGWETFWGEFITREEYRKQRKERLSPLSPLDLGGGVHEGEQY